jgi:pimeloyl-ACP methyl ester carboxylesterase
VTQSPNDVLAFIAAIPNVQPGFPDMLPKMTTPCLVYVGEEDQLTYSGAAEAVEILPNVTFVTLPGIAHLDGYSRSDMALQHIKSFLANVP